MDHQGNMESSTHPQVPQAMVEQAEAAVSAAGNDTATMSPSQQRHMGHDVAIADVHDTDVETPEQDVPPPAYGEYYGSINGDRQGFGTKASVADDGRVNIRINQKNRTLSSLLVPTLRQLQEAADKEHVAPQVYVPPSLGGAAGVPPPPPMNVVIHVVGSRGDVQPFVALGKVLKDTYGHRVRLATHPNFKDFVTENGLEFFSIGGDPAALMAFMVKNPGLMPGFDSLRTGDVGKRRREVGEYLKGCWRSCFETGDGLGPEVTDETIEDWTNHADDDLVRPFVADCIIANPPSFAHVHIAEKMGIPLHIMFTMPYSPTQAFPHPLANIQSSNADDHLTNYVSYALIDMLTWQGLGDVINRFRQRCLGLEPISLMWAPGMLQRLQIPHTYCWSPALIPKPRDWGANISISGFFFLNLASNYTPDPELKAFLDAGPPPVYIGFGSIVLDDPNTMTKLLFEAVRKTGQRALVSKGWGGMGADELGKPDNVFMLGNVPHDWLFKHVSCVVHHGGAGTTAAGITAGRPTVVVPFFGDQPFWGAMVARAGAGPAPIPHKQLTADNLAEAIMQCLKPESQERAQELAASIAEEQGSDVGAQSFHQFLNVDKLRCNLLPTHAAVWRVKRTQVRLSALAACTLANEGLLDFNDLKLYRPREYDTEDGPWDPITGGATALIGTASAMMLGVADFPIETLKALKIHPDSTKPKKDKGTGSDDGKQTDTSSSVRTSDESKGSGPSSGAHSSPGTAVTSGASTPTHSRANSTFNVHESLAKLSASPPASPGLTPNRMSGSMADALRGQLNGPPRTRSRSGSGSSSRPRSRGPSFSSGPSMLQTGLDTGKGVHRIVGAGLKSPMDFTTGLARGFHNAPKLYGDETVRKADQITDFKSGLKAATKEFGFGLYDGITGLVTQPVSGAKKEGAAGFFKGVGKGIGGIMLKPGAAVFGIPGYTMKGLYKELKKFSGASVQNYIIAARTAQGFDEWQRSTFDERRDIVSGWKRIQKDLKKKRNPDELVRDIFEEQMRKKEQWLDAKRQERQEKRRSRSRAASTSAFSHSSDRPYNNAESAVLAQEGHPETRHRSHTLTPGPDAHVAHNAALDEAIRLSVQQTSQGDADEDAAVEQGIRASMAEYQQQTHGIDRRASRIDAHEEDELRRALEQSAAEAEHYRDTVASHDRDLEHALAQSLKEHRGWRGGGSGASSPGFAPSSDHPLLPPPPYDPLRGAGESRKPLQQATDQKTPLERSEEEVVLEYVKKQSLLEQQHRRKMEEDFAASGSHSSPQDQNQSQVPVDEPDEELQRAIKLSLQETGGK